MLLYIIYILHYRSYLNDVEVVILRWPAPHVGLADVGACVRGGEVGRDVHLAARRLGRRGASEDRGARAVHRRLLLQRVQLQLQLLLALFLERLAQCAPFLKLNITEGSEREREKCFI